MPTITNYPAQSEVAILARVQSPLPGAMARYILSLGFSDAC
jgi:hypothetical protein